MTIRQIHFHERSMVDYYRQSPTAGFSSSHRAPYPATSPYAQTQTAALTRPLLPPAASHSRTRTSSSSALPASEPQPSMSLSLQQAQQQYLDKDRSRRASIATFSTTGSNGNTFNMQRQGPDSSAASPPRRSTSSRSSSAATSYVALMRKQKAT